MIDSESIEQHIEENPDHPGPADACLADSGIDVWLVVAYANSVAGNLERVAETYDISLESVQAACAYYSRHKELIDARITLEHAAFS